MLEIEHDKSYLYLYNDIKSIFTFDEVEKICFQGSFKNKEVEEMYIEEIADYLEDNYKMYQYKKDNGIEFGEEDLFYWSNGESLYFDVTLKGDKEKLKNEILNYLQSKYNDSDLYIRLQYTRSINWNLVHKYLEQEFDINNLPFDDLGALYDISKKFKNKRKFKEEEIEKLNNLLNDCIKKYENKKVLLKNGIKGTIIYIHHMEIYGLFEPRVKKRFIPLSFSDIQGLEVIKNFK